MLRRTLFISALLFPSFCFALTAGPNYAGTAANDTSSGTVAWTDPTNATASDDVRATITTGASNISNYIKATNFGFSVPAGSTIDGILVEIEEDRNGQENGSGRESGIKIVKADGTIGTTNKSTGAALPTTDTFVSYGGAADLWGEAWTSTDTNDVDFGAVFNVWGVTNTGQQVVDSFRITITYTAAPVPELSEIGLLILLLACLYLAHREGWLRFSGP